MYMYMYIVCMHCMSVSENGRWKSEVSVDTLLAIPGVRAADRDTVSHLYILHHIFPRSLSQSTIFLSFSECGNPATGVSPCVSGPSGFS